MAPAGRQQPRERQRSSGAKIPLWDFDSSPPGSRSAGEKIVEPGGCRYGSEPPARTGG
jgi:hypothetical protein